MDYVIQFCVDNLDTILLIAACAAVLALTIGIAFVPTDPREGK